MNVKAILIFRGQLSNQLQTTFILLFSERVLMLFSQRIEDMFKCYKIAATLLKNERALIKPSDVYVCACVHCVCVFAYML